MSSYAVAHARWYSHVNAVHPPRELRDWLVDTASLTVKLTARSAHFRVQCLHQRHARCLADEFAALALPRRTCVQEREVLLQCDGRPTVYAHTIVPLQATASDWPFFGTLGERSLGSTLFGDPRVLRGPLRFAQLHARHPLARRARAATGCEVDARPLFARRCLYRRRHGALLVTELFLPAIGALKLPGPARARQSGVSVCFRIDELTRSQAKQSNEFIF